MNCAHYQTYPSQEHFCARTGKVVGALWKETCWEPQGKPRYLMPICKVQDTSGKPFIEQHRMKELYNNRFNNKAKSMEEKKTKVCKDCGRELPIDSFPLHWKSSDGHNSVCKECFKKKQSKPHKKEKEYKSDNDSPFTPLEKAAMRAVDETAKVIKLSHYSDAELLAELKLRGYSGTISKQFTL